MRPDEVREEEEKKRAFLSVCLRFKEAAEECMCKKRGTKENRCSAGGGE